MRIILITPGSGDNFYCENCLRDNALVRQLRHQGHDALLVPLYLPAQLEDTGKGLADHVFFGGINVYLQQKLALFRHTPRWIDRLFDSPRLLRHAAKMTGMTDAAELGRTTISMLQGPQGRQKKELDRLLQFLTSQHRPDVVVLSNALLAGLAQPIRNTLRVPVVCLLQDEDEFLDILPQPYRDDAWNTLRDCTRHVDAFVPVSRFYANLMTRRLQLPPEKTHVIYAGIPTDAYSPAPNPPRPPTIGFLSRMFEEKGLDLLVDAFLQLRKDPPLANLRLRCAGGHLAPDKPYLDKIRQQLRDAHAESSVEILPALDGPERRDFLQSLFLLCVPERRGEACGLYVFEAWASAIPVIEPNHGVFPELLDAASGGLLFQPNNLASLTAALRDLLTDPERARALGRNGYQAVREKFDVAVTAQQMLALYETLKTKAKP